MFAHDSEHNKLYLTRAYISVSSSCLVTKKTRKDALLEVVIEKSMYRKFLLNARALIRNCALSRI